MRGARSRQRLASAFQLRRAHGAGEPAADGRPVGDAARLHAPRALGQRADPRRASAGGADRQRGPGPGRTICRRTSTAELVFGEAASQLKPLGPGSARGVAGAGPGRVPVGPRMRPGRRSPAGSSTWSRTRCPPSASSASRARPTAACCKIELEAADDYGVAELALLLAPPGGEGEAERLALLKPANQPPKVATGTYQDLTAHPLAGLPVDAAARGGRRDRAARPERAAGDRRCRRASSAIRWRARSSSSGASSWRRPKTSTRWRAAWRRWATRRRRSSCRRPCRWRCGSRRHGWR